jgi:hypothetical protein
MKQKNLSINKDAITIISDLDFNKLGYFILEKENAN